MTGSDPSRCSWGTPLGDILVSFSVFILLAGGTLIGLGTIWIEDGGAAIFALIVHPLGYLAAVGAIAFIQHGRRSTYRIEMPAMVGICAGLTALLGLDLLPTPLDEPDGFFSPQGGMTTWMALWIVPGLIAATTLARWLDTRTVTSHEPTDQCPGLGKVWVLPVSILLTVTILLGWLLPTVVLGLSFGGEGLSIWWFFAPAVGLGLTGALLATQSHRRDERAGEGRALGSLLHAVAFESLATSGFLAVLLSWLGISWLIAGRFDEPFVTLGMAGAFLAATAMACRSPVIGVRDRMRGSAVDPVIGVLSAVTCLVALSFLTSLGDVRVFWWVPLSLADANQASLAVIGLAYLPVVLFLSITSSHSTWTISPRRSLKP